LRDERGGCFLIDLDGLAFFLVSFNDDRLLKLVDTVPLPTGLFASYLRFMGRLRPAGADFVDFVVLVKIGCCKPSSSPRPPSWSYGSPWGEAPEPTSPPWRTVWMAQIASATVRGSTGESNPQWPAPGWPSGLQRCPWARLLP
jgi:hypothetical protein